MIWAELKGGSSSSIHVAGSQPLHHTAVRNPQSLTSEADCHIVQLEVQLQRRLILYTWRHEVPNMQFGWGGELKCCNARHSACTPQHYQSTHLWPARRRRAACSAPGHPPAATRIAGCGRCRHAPGDPRCKSKQQRNQAALEHALAQNIPSGQRGSQCCSAVPPILRHAPNTGKEPIVPVVGRQVAPGRPRRPKLGVSVKVDGDAAQGEGLRWG